MTTQAQAIDGAVNREWWRKGAGELMLCATPASSARG